MQIHEEWKGLARLIRDAGLKIAATAEIARTQKGAADEKVLAITLLARTVSNMKGALLLIDAERIVEARTIVRCVFENFYWIIGLAEEGDAFIRKMRQDEITYSRARGQDIFNAGIELDPAVCDRLRSYLKELGKTSSKANTLNPKQAAQIRPDLEKTYIFYGQLSADAGHPSVSALNRYIVSNSHPDGAGIDMEPPVSDGELTQTVEFLCMAAMGVCVAANQLVGGTLGGACLNDVADRYSDLSDRTKAATVCKPE